MSDIQDAKQYYKQLSKEHQRLMGRKNQNLPTHIFEVQNLERDLLEAESKLRALGINF